MMCGTFSTSAERNVKAAGRLSSRTLTKRNRFPNCDDLIAASTSVKMVASAKTDHSRKKVYLPDELLQDLTYYKEIKTPSLPRTPGYNREGYVFCQENAQPYEPRTYQDLFKRCVRRAGIKDANFHALCDQALPGLHTERHSDF